MNLLVNIIVYKVAMIRIVVKFRGWEEIFGIAKAEGWYEVTGPDDDGRIKESKCVVTIAEANIADPTMRRRLEISDVARIFT